MSVPSLTGDKDPDFGATEEDYTAYRLPYPAALYRRLRDRGIGVLDQRVVEIGAGTGLLGRPMARAGARLLASDVSLALIDAARRLDAVQAPHVRHVAAAAERLPLPDEYAEAIIAGQCWHWFERGRAAAECARVLVPGGSVAIVHYDWVPLADNVVAATEALMRGANPSWSGGDGLGQYPEWLRDLGLAGFTDLQSFSFDVSVPLSHEAWRGRVRASAAIGASLDHEQVAAFDERHAHLLAERFPDEPLLVPHRVFAALGRKAVVATPASPSARSLC